MQRSGVNPYKRANQVAKAARLVNALSPTLPRDLTPGTVGPYVRAMTPEEWDPIMLDADVESFSSETLELVIATLENDCAWSSELDTQVEYYAFNGEVLH